jgi:hypothetical protein
MRNRRRTNDRVAAGAERALRLATLIGAGSTTVVLQAGDEPLEVTHDDESTSADLDRRDTIVADQLVHQ